MNGFKVIFFSTSCVVLTACSNSNQIRSSPALNVDVAASKVEKQQPRRVPKAKEQIVISNEPDTPRAFGFKTSWFAIKTTDTQAVISALNLANVKEANWESGQATVYNNNEKVAAFVMPPINGWTLVHHDLGLAADTDINIKRLEGVLQILSAKFGEAQHFGSYRVVGYTSWFLARDGKIERSFSYAGGGDGFILNKGRVTKEEIDIGFTDISNLSIDELNDLDPLFEPGGTVYWPDEEDPARLAEFWSINPLKLESVASQKSTGHLGVLDDV